MKGDKLGWILLFVFIGLVIYQKTCNTPKPDDSQVKFWQKAFHNTLAEAKRKSALFSDSVSKIKAVNDPKVAQFKKKLAEVRKTPIHNDTIREYYAIIEDCDSIITADSAIIAIQGHHIDNLTLALDSVEKIVPELEKAYQHQLKAVGRENLKLRVTNTVLIVSGAILALLWLVK